ncbi:MAG: integrase core domain-containing protein [Desertimonas sp.]
MTVVAFCARLGIPRPTWYRWKAASSSSKGPWPTPAQDALEADAKARAAGWDAWGHRKLAELKRVGIDDVEAGPVSDSTMYRVLKRNGPCFKSGGFAAWVASERHIVHIRTRKQAPWTNGVIERFFGALKYERLYRRDIADGVCLARHALDFQTIYNSIRPHETIAMARPLERYRQTPTSNNPDPGSVSDA